MEKIKENGSLYAVPSTNETSQETEMKELLENMDSVIQKPDRLLKDNEITDVYKRFRLQIEKLKEDEEREEQAKREKQIKRRKEQRINAKRSRDLDVLETSKYGSQPNINDYLND